MELTPEVLRVLAAGIQNLNDGDLADRAVTAAVERTMAAEHGLVRSGQAWHPASEATSGHDVFGVYVWQSYEGAWVDDMGNAYPSGTQLYFDEQGRIPLRTIP